MMRSTELTVRLPGVRMAPITSTRTWSQTGAVKKLRNAAISEMITGGTITDDQIRTLREQAWEDYARACYALGFSPHGGKISYDESRVARYECAEILNARDAKDLP